MLTNFQKRFVAEVLITPQSESDAIRRAGYRGKYADVRASQIKSIPAVAEAIAKGQKKIADKLEVTAERVLSEINKLANVNADDYLDITEDSRVLNLSKPTRDQMACICEITEDTTGGEGDGERKAVLRTKIKFWDKTKSLELLGRHLKLFTDRIEMKVEGDLANEILTARQAAQLVRNGEDDRSHGA